MIRLKLIKLFRKSNKIKIISVSAFDVLLFLYAMCYDIATYSLLGEKCYLSQK